VPLIGGISRKPLECILFAVLIVLRLVAMVRILFSLSAAIIGTPLLLGLPG
jgi:hypothetical protein